MTLIDDYLDEAEKYVKKYGQWFYYIRIVFQVILGGEI